MVRLPALSKEATLSVAQLIRMRGALARALSTDDVNELGRRTGQSKRLRTITPHRLFLSTVAGLAGGQVESLADLLREFNHQNDVTVAYKAFYNRLARPGFAKFMRQMFDRLLARLCMHTLAPEGHAAVSRFKDIVIQDGSSFALKNKLRDVFPGRFTTIEPAAGELHATYSGFSDEVCSVEIAPDKEAERQFLPKPSTLNGKLLLADRGYPGVTYFKAIDEHGGSFIVRLTRSHDSWVRAAWIDGDHMPLNKPTRLSVALHRPERRPPHGSRRRIRTRQGQAPGGLPRRCPTRQRNDHDASVHQPPAHTVLPRSRLTALPVPMADRTTFQGMEVVREPPQVRHRQRAHRDSGKPISTRRVARPRWDGVLARQRTSL
jgi:hypothetical protein